MKLLTFFLIAAAVANAACELLPSNVRVPVRRKTPKKTNKKLPYHVGIVVEESDSSTSWCSGSLIDNQFVLTAAHCLVGAEKATLYLGSSKFKAGKVIHEVNKENFIIHSKWHARLIKNDIALIKIPYTKYDKNIAKIKLSNNRTSNYNEGEEFVYTSGWEHASNKHADKSEDLEWSIMHVIDNDLCSEFFGSGAVKPYNICARSYGSISTCKGDPGAALVLQSNNKKRNNLLIGIESFGDVGKSCEKGIPFAFTRVSHFSGWISKQMKRAASKKN